MLHRWFFLFTVPLILLTSCIPDPLDLALNGTLPEDEANAVITDYCQTCHIHRTFEAADHAPRMQMLYDSEPYSAALQCRTCHLVGENTWGMKSRKTIFPADAAGSGVASARQHGFTPAILNRITKWLRPGSKDDPDAQAGAQDGTE